MEENTTQERKHLRKDIPQMLKQQIPNHQLHKISHKMSPSQNNSHKMSPSVNNNHRAKHPLILNRDLSHHNSAMMTNFQIHMPLPQKLLRQKILDLQQRNQNIVEDQNTSHFIHYTCVLFSLYRSKKNKIHTRKTHVLQLNANISLLFSSTNQTFN